MIRSLVFLSLFFFLAQPGYLMAGSANDRPIVAVFPMQDLSEKLEKKLLDSLTEYLAAAVAQNGLFSIQAPGDMRRVLLEKKTESYEECFDEKCQIQLGRELAANKIISSKIIRLGDSCTVTAALYDLLTQATDITATADGDCTPKGLKNSLDLVASKIRAWAVGKRSPGKSDLKESTLGEPVKRLQDSAVDEEVIVYFEPSPANCVVIVDGALVCEKTPCSRKFQAGAHLVSIQKKRFLGHKEQVIFSKGSVISWELEPLFGLLNVSSIPAGLDVLLNGEKVGSTPLKDHPVDPGIYEVLVASPCFYDRGERIHIEAHQRRDLSFELQPKLGGIDLDVKDSDGNDIPAEIFVDGQKLGEAPGKFKVSVCAKRIQARSSQKGFAEHSLSVQEGQWRQLTMTIDETVRRSSKGENKGVNSSKSSVAFFVNPTVGYSSIDGVNTEVHTDGTSTSSSTVGVNGPTVGMRMDFILNNFWSAMARYDYLFSKNSGFGVLGIGIHYGGLFTNLSGGNNKLLPDLVMWIGGSFLHGDAGSFEDDLGRSATDAIMDFGLVMSMELKFVVVLWDWIAIGASGEVGYLTSLAERDDKAISGFEWSVQGHIGIVIQ